MSKILKAKELLGKGYNVSQIMYVTGLSKEMIEAISHEKPGPNTVEVVRGPGGRLQSKMPITNQSTEPQKKRRFPDIQSDVKKETDSSQLVKNTVVKEVKKEEHFKQYQQDMNLLMEWYPKLFNKARNKPLKIGIQKELRELLQDKMPLPRLKKAIYGYVMGQRYTENFIKSTHRYDLNGEPTEEISEAHMEDAKKQWEKILEYRAKKKQSQKEA